MVRTASKAGQARPPISPAGRADHRREDGFTLIEVVCALAIIAILVAVMLPAIPRGTSRTRLEAYAIEAATLLKADRDAAIRRHAEIATQINAPSRSLRSGATGKTLRMPQDVHFEAILARFCNRRAAGPTINFFASGMSCGGTIALTRPNGGFQIRVNWLTGGIEVVQVKGL
jgi:general secretion pathway protein H